MTYTDTSETDIIDVKVITNSGISSSGNIAKTVINKYSNATISNDIITPQGDPIDRETIDNTSFDNRETPYLKQYSEKYIVTARSYLPHTRAYLIISTTRISHTPR